MADVLTHPKCGKSWTQRGNRTGHCSKCHETFEGITLFDAHQRLDDRGQVICKDPTDMVHGGEPLRNVNGTWRGPEMPQRARDLYAR